MRVNIYITPQNSLKLNAISRKYEVSKSTIAENVLFYLTKYLNRENKEDVRIQLGTNYVRKAMGNKTCIKPKRNASQDLYKNLTKAYTNALFIYLEREIDNYITKENATMFYNELNTALQKTNEPNWDYNHFRRQMARYMEKKNESN